MLERLLPIAVAAALLTGCSTAVEKQEEVRAALRSALAPGARPAYVTRDGEGKRLWQLTREFYARRDHAPAWIEGTGPERHMAELIRALEAAHREGLDPQLYHVRLLEQRRQEAKQGILARRRFTAAEAGSLDVWLTYVYLKYASDLADGLSDLAHADPDWQIKPETFDPTAHLEHALQRSSVRESLLKLAPENPQYVALRKVLADYRAVAAQGGWPRLPAELRAKRGQKGPSIALLARRLAASGDYQRPLAQHDASLTFDQPLLGALKRFQRRHGLQEDGVVGKGVLAALNVPVEERIRQVELNLERWRWLPRNLGERYILVNVPEYRLEVWDRGAVPLTMRIVVGKRDTPTPIFNDEMTYLVFSPFWNVPPDIADGETLPAVLNDPGFLERMNMEALDERGNVIDPLTIDLSDPAKYRFRQRPGAGNSLGLVKFMFPNEHHVYLHDTPADSLFAWASRSFSHGCVRVEEPLALAEYLLRDQPQWTRERIQEAMHAGEERTVKLRSPIPVYLGYWTARVAADGTVQFMRDVYGVDARQNTLLAGRLQRLRQAASAAAAGGAAGTGSRTPRAGGRTAKQAATVNSTD